MPATDAQKQALTAEATSGYRPTVARPSFLSQGLPTFNIWTIETMRRDDQVKLAMKIKAAPMLAPKLNVEAPEPAKTFIQTQLEAVWSELPKLVSGLWYTRAVGEALYRMKEGQVHFSGLKAFFPTDASLLLRKSNRYGLRVGMGDGTRHVDLTAPKAFSFIHGREFGEWSGRSEFEGAYEPWLEKCDRIGGAKASRKLWFHKSAFQGGIIYYPNKTYPRGEGMPPIHASDMAREIVELSMSGGVHIFPNDTDTESGKREWELIPGSINGGGAEILNYIENLNTEIVRGMGIPDDIVKQDSGTGSYAGRTIPFIAFMESEQITLNGLLADIKEQILDHLVWLNFGPIDYAVSAKVDKSVFLPDEQGDGEGKPQQPEGGKPTMAGGGEKPGQPKPTQPVQLSEGGNCGTGAGGFKSGNTCAKGGDKSKPDAKYDQATGRTNGYLLDAPNTEPKELAGDPATIIKSEPIIGGLAVRDIVKDIASDPDTTDTVETLTEQIADLELEFSYIKNEDKARYRIDRYLEDHTDDEGNVNGEDAYDHANRIMAAWAPPPKVIAEEIFRLVEEHKAKKAARIAEKKAAKAAAKKPVGDTK